MAGHTLGGVKGTAVNEISGDAGAAQAVAADLRRDAGVLVPSLYPEINLCRKLFCMESPFDDDGSELIADTVAEATPLIPLPVSPWRSLGGYFNYENWRERERFCELDKALMWAKAQDPEEWQAFAGRHEAGGRTHPACKSPGLLERSESTPRPNFTDELVA